MSEKRFVSRNLAIALEILCVVLASGLVGVIANYTSVINEKDHQIQTLRDQTNSLQTWLEGNMTLYNSQIESLNSEIISLQEQVSSLTDLKNQLQVWLNENITMLNNTRMWLQGNVTYYAYKIGFLNFQIDSLNNQIANLQNQIDSLNLQFSSLNSEIAAKDHQIELLNLQISSLSSEMAAKDHLIENLSERITELENETYSLQSQLSYLGGIVNLEELTIWVYYQTISQQANSSMGWIFNIQYAGYIVVDVHSSTSNSTYVRAAWSSYGVNYDHTITVGASGSAAFPVLPASGVEVMVGNLDASGEETVTITLTIAYYY